MAAVILRLDAGSHQFLIDRSPIGGRINGHLLGVRSAAAVGAQRVQYAPQILVNLQSLQQCRFAVNQRNEYAGSDITTRLKWKKNLLANGTFPRASIAVHLKVGFQIEALDVFALVPSGRQCYPLEGDGAF